VRIAVYHNLPSGGGKRALYEMVRRLSKTHQVDVYALSCAEHEFCDLRPFASRHVVFPFNPLQLARRPFGRLNQGIRALDLLRLRTVQKRIAAQINGADYDVAFVHHCRFGQAPSLLRFLTVPSIYYCHEPPRLIYERLIPRPATQLSALQRIGNRFDPLPALYRRFLISLDRASVRAASLVLVNSAYSRETLYRTYGLMATVCGLGVDSQRFHPQTSQKQHMVLSVGALVPLKGFDLLIRSLALLDKASRPRLVIASNFTDPDEHTYLHALACRLGVIVEFRSQIDDDELVQLYNQACLTAYSPVMEPFGFVPLESMACGTPVVGVREGGVRETVIHGVTGLLAERDPADLAAAIGTLFTDVDLSSEMGRNGRSCVQAQWTWDKALVRLERFLAETASEQQAEVGGVCP
jgi:glycosyltransferase involved in cell wall biosynthesis